jgi:hydrogenase maturation protease
VADPKILLIGFGNPGREDDGIGPALAEEVARWNLPGVTVDSNYQLQVEDSAAVSEADVVIFIDAAAEGPEPFFFKRVSPGGQFEFSSHSVRPEAVLELTKQIFGREVDAYILGIRGYYFNQFKEGLSSGGKKNLWKAMVFLERVLRTRTFQTRS